MGIISQEKSPTSIKLRRTRREEVVYHPKLISGSFHKNALSFINKLFFHFFTQGFLHKKRRIVSSKYNGFTLAEVLICLAVIGVVASLTIPTLISSTSDKQVLVQAKKEYSILSQAVKKLEAENGTINVNASSSVVTSQFASVLNVARIDTRDNIMG